MKGIFLESYQGAKVAVSALMMLTASECRVLLLLANDYQNAEIAEELCVTTRTVETYVNRIGSKLGFSGRFNLSRTARRNKDLIISFFAKYYDTTG